MAGGRHGASTAGRGHVVAGEIDRMDSGVPKPGAQGPSRPGMHGGRSPPAAYDAGERSWGKTEQWDLSVI